MTPKSNGPAQTDRGLMMPTRQRTRAQDRAYRIALERQHNAARIARKQLLLAERIASDDEPPPFELLVVSPYPAVGFAILKSLRVLGRGRCRIGTTGSPPRVDLALAGRRIPSALHHI